MIRLASSMAQFEAQWRWVLTTGLILEACIDLPIATSLCYYLVKCGRNTVHQRWVQNGSVLTVECSSDELIYRTIRLLEKLVAITIRECYVASIVLYNDFVTLLATGLIMGLAAVITVIYICLYH
jgi:hypothetical protein